MQLASQNQILPADREYINTKLSEIASTTDPDQRFQRVVTFSFELASSAYSPKPLADVISGFVNKTKQIQVVTEMGLYLLALNSSGRPESAEKLRNILADVKPSTKSMEFIVNLFDGVNAYQRGDKENTSLKLTAALVAEATVPASPTDSVTTLGVRLKLLPGILSEYIAESLPKSLELPLREIFNGVTNSPKLDSKEKQIRHYQQAHLVEGMSTEEILSIGICQLDLARQLIKNKEKVVLVEALIVQPLASELKNLKSVVKDIFPNGLPQDPTSVTTKQLIAVANLGGPLIAAAFVDDVKLLPATGPFMQEVIVQRLNKFVPGYIERLTERCLVPGSALSKPSKECGEIFHDSFRTFNSYVFFAREFDAIRRSHTELTNSNINTVALVYGSEHRFDEAIELVFKNRLTAPRLLPIDVTKGASNAISKQGVLLKNGQMKPIITASTSIRELDLAMFSKLEDKKLLIDNLTPNVISRTRPAAYGEFLLGAACGRTSCNPKDAQELKNRIEQLKKDHRGPFAQ